jgi:hypothetical protein
VSSIITDIRLSIALRAYIGRVKIISRLFFNPNLGISSPSLPHDLSPSMHDHYKIDWVPAESCEYTVIELF